MNTYIVVMVPSCVRFASYYMKNIYGLERHKYAPEMNKLWYTDDTFDRVPGCVTIDEAEKYVVKYNVNDSKRLTMCKLNTKSKR